MIYTIGNTQLYERHFSEQTTPHKMGRRERDESGNSHPGGSVWQTVEEARQHCPPGFAVYGVLADWATQTLPSPGNDWHDLQIDAPLVQLPTSSPEASALPSLPPA